MRDRYGSYLLTTLPLTTHHSPLLSTQHSWLGPPRLYGNKDTNQGILGESAGQRRPRARTGQAVEPEPAGRCAALGHLLGRSLDGCQAAEENHFIKTILPQPPALIETFERSVAQVA